MSNHSRSVTIEFLNGNSAFGLTSREEIARCHASRMALCRGGLGSARKNRNSSGSIEHNKMQLGRSMLQLDKLQRHCSIHRSEQTTSLTQSSTSRIASFSGFSTALRSFLIPRCPLQSSCRMFLTVTPVAFFADSADALLPSDCASARGEPLNKAASSSSCSGTCTASSCLRKAGGFLELPPCYITWIFLFIQAYRAWPFRWWVAPADWLS